MFKCRGGVLVNYNRHNWFNNWFFNRWFLSGNFNRFFNQGHASDRAVAGFIPLDLGMHRALIDSFCLGKGQVAEDKASQEDPKKPHVMSSY
jgi:hypothetical protein